MWKHRWSQGWSLDMYLTLLGAIILSPVLLAAPASTNDDKSAGARSPVIAAGDAVREEAACARCHQGVVKASVKDPHARPGQPAAGPGASCASCHGPGEAHIQSGGDKSKIFNPAEAAAKEVNDRCLNCHAGKHEVFQTSAHGRGNVSCIRCHIIHGNHKSEHLLAVSQPDLCFQCHEEQRPQFSATFRHKVIEGLVLCTDCHEPHGSFGERLQRFPAQEDIVCTKCHIEIAGPFEYEHAIVKTEGCTACHSPHGGPNQHMLNRARVNTICLLCHFPPKISSTGESLIEGHDLTAGLQLCTDCHADIHGSNVNAVFSKKK